MRPHRDVLIAPPPLRGEGWEGEHSLAIANKNDSQYYPRPASSVSPYLRQSTDRTTGDLHVRSFSSITIEPYCWRDPGRGNRRSARHDRARERTASGHEKGHSTRRRRATAARGVELDEVHTTAHRDAANCRRHSARSDLAAERHDASRGIAQHAWHHVSSRRRRG